MSYVKRSKITKMWLLKLGLFPRKIRISVLNFNLPIFEKNNKIPKVAIFWHRTNWQQSCWWLTIGGYFRTLVTELKSWWHRFDIGDLYKPSISDNQNSLSHFKSVTNTFCLQYPSLTPMEPRKPFTRLKNLHDQIKKNWL